MPIDRVSSFDGNSRTTCARMLLVITLLSSFGWWRTVSALGARKFIPGLEPEGASSVQIPAAIPRSAPRSPRSSRSSLSSLRSRSQTGGYMPSRAGAAATSGRSLGLVPNEESEDTTEDISEPHEEQTDAHQTAAQSPPPPSAGVEDTIHAFRRRRLQRAYDLEAGEQMRKLLVEQLKKKGRGPDGRPLNVEPVAPPKTPEPPAPIPVVQVEPPPAVPFEQLAATQTPETPWLLYGSVGALLFFIMLCCCGGFLMMLAKSSPEKSRGKKGKSSKKQSSARNQQQAFSYPGEVRVVGYVPR